MEYKFEGKHWYANVKNCKIEEVNKTLIENALNESGATILAYSEHIFDNGAITFSFLLSESHCCVHTYPEYKSFFIDLFTCGEKCNISLFKKIITEKTNPEIMDENLIYRK